MSRYEVKENDQAARVPLQREISTAPNYEQILGGNNHPVGFTSDVIYGPTTVPIVKNQDGDSVAVHTVYLEDSRKLAGTRWSGARRVGQGIRRYNMRRLVLGTFAIAVLVCVILYAAISGIPRWFGNN